MFNQMQIESLSEAPFCSTGDSGALVFTRRSRAGRPALSGPAHRRLRLRQPHPRRSPLTRRNLRLNEPGHPEQARAAKATLRARLAGLPGLRGLGVAFLPEGCGVKVMLERPSDGAVIPEEVDGVPVVVEIIDELTLL